MMSAGGLAALGLVVVGPATGILAGGSWALFNIGQSLHSVYNQRRARAHLSVPGFDELVALRIKQLSGVAIIGIAHEREPGAAPCQTTPSLCTTLPSTSVSTDRICRISASGTVK